MTIAAYPLAHKNGIEVFVSLIEADQVWRQLTKRQRELVTTLSGPIIQALYEDREPPSVKIGCGNKHTLESLRRKGMIDSDNVLTAKAVRAAYWTQWRES